MVSQTVKPCVIYTSTRQESGEFYSDLRNASSLEPCISMSTVAVVQLPCQLNRAYSCTAWSTGWTV